MPKRAPKRRRASTPASAAVSDVDGAYPVRQFRGPKGPAHSFSNHEDKAILRAFARYATVLTTSHTKPAAQHLSTASGHTA